MLSIANVIALTVYFALINWENFFKEESCSYLTTVPLTILNTLRNCLFINTFGIVNVLASQVIFAFTLLTFAQFKAINSALVSFGSSGSSYNQQWRHLAVAMRAFSRFTSAHTRAVVSVLKRNAVIGSQLLLFYVFLVPANTYLLVAILFGRVFTRLTALVFASIVLLVYVAIFLFHQLASAFTGKIHRCSGPLLGLAAAETEVRILRQKRKNGGYTGLFTTVEKLRLDGYIAKFHVGKHHRYGITYGEVGGLMSSQSFLKVFFSFDFCLMQGFF